MNKERREKIRNIIAEIEADENEKNFKDIIKRIEKVMYGEQDAFDNLPEGFQCSYRGEMMEEAVSNMEDAIDYLEEGELDYAISSLEDAMM